MSTWVYGKPKPADLPLGRFGASDFHGATIRGIWVYKLVPHYETGRQAEGIIRSRNFLT